MASATKAAGVANRVPGFANPDTVRILGIDPGSQRTGVGVVDIDGNGRTTHVFHTALTLTANATFPLRLKQLFAELSAVIDMYRPDEAAIERVFLARNPDSALKLGQARGAAICALVNKGLDVAEYSAREIKQAVVGGGAAEKRQIQHMISILLNIDRKIQADAADALAIALTHAHARIGAQRLGSNALAQMIATRGRTAWRRRGSTRSGWSQP